jgi:hypothetical protein
VARGRKGIRNAEEFGFLTGSPPSATRRFWKAPLKYYTQAVAADVTAV